VTTTTSQSFGQWLISTLEADLAGTAGGPVVTLLQNWETHAGNPLLQGADLLAFQGAAPAAGLQLEVELQQQLLAMVISKVQAKIASIGIPVPASPAAVASANHLANTAGPA
jgi:hypothetical protein